MICCLDLEGVLIPEIWIAIARKTKLKELERTTRDEPDYDKLMRYRLTILKREKIKLKDIQTIIKKMSPLAGAKEFLKKLRTKYQVIVLSDTYYEFAMPLIEKLGNPALFCNALSVDKNGFIANYHLRQRDGKKFAALGLKKMGFEVVAAGDSYNDISMLSVADKGILFRAPERIIKEFPQFKATKTYAELLKAFGI